MIENFFNPRAPIIYRVQKMTTIHTLKITYTIYNNIFSHKNKKPIEISYRKYHTSKEVSYVAKVRFRYATNTNINPIGFQAELTIKLNENEVDKTYIKELVEKAKKNPRKLIEQFGLNPEDCSTYQVFTRLMNYLTEIVEPYSTEGIEVKKMYDLGGDVPCGEFELYYYA